MIDRDVRRERDEQYVPHLGEVETILLTSYVYFQTNIFCVRMRHTSLTFRVTSLNWNKFRSHMCVCVCFSLIIKLNISFILQFIEYQR